MDFKAIERRAREVAEEAAIQRANEIRDLLCKEAGIGTSFGGPPDEFRKVWVPMRAYLIDLLIQRNINSYHHQAEQAAIDKLREIINAPKG